MLRGQPLESRGLGFKAWLYASWLQKPRRKYPNSPSPDPCWQDAEEQQHLWWLAVAGNEKENARQQVLCMIPGVKKGLCGSQATAGRTFVPDSASFSWWDVGAMRSQPSELEMWLPIPALLPSEGTTRSLNLMFWSIKWGYTAASFLRC